MDGRYDKEEGKMKYILSVFLAVALLVSCAAALCEQGGMEVFCPDGFIARVNGYKDQLADIAFEGYESGSVEELKAYLNVAFIEEVEGVVYFDNGEYTVEAIATYYDGDVDQDKPADMLGLCFHKGFSADVSRLLQLVMGCICQDVDAGTSCDDAVAWMQGNRADGDTLELRGATLRMNENDEYIQYSLIRREGT